MHKTYLKQTANGYDIEQTDAYIAAVRTEYEKCLGVIESLRAENAALAEKCADFEKENKRIVTQCNQRIAELDECMKNEISALSGQLDSVYARLNVVNSTATANEIPVTITAEAQPAEPAFSDKVEAMKQQSKILEESVKAQKNRINSDISELTGKFRSLRSRLNTD